MSQTTKLFVVVGFMFLFYITANGHLEKYLKILFSSGSSNSVNIGGAPISVPFGDVVGGLLKGVGIF